MRLHATALLLCYHLCHQHSLHRQMQGCRQHCLRMPPHKRLRSPSCLKHHNPRCKQLLSQQHLLVKQTVCLLSSECCLARGRQVRLQLPRSNQVAPNQCLVRWPEHPRKQVRYWHHILLDADEEIKRVMFIVMVQLIHDADESHTSISMMPVAGDMRWHMQPPIRIINLTTHQPHVADTKALCVQQNPCHSTTPASLSGRPEAAWQMRALRPHRARRSMADLRQIRVQLHSLHLQRQPTRSARRRRFRLRRPRLLLQRRGDTTTRLLCSADSPMCALPT